MQSCNQQTLLSEAVQDPLTRFSHLVDQKAPDAALKRFMSWPNPTSEPPRVRQPVEPNSQRHGSMLACPHAAMGTCSLFSYKAIALEGTAPRTSINRKVAAGPRFRPRWGEGRGQSYSAGFSREGFERTQRPFIAKPEALRLPETNQPFETPNSIHLSPALSSVEAGSPRQGFT